MAGKWDSITKLLVRARPSQFAGWLIPRSTLVAVPNVELTAAQFFADALLQVLIDGRLGLLHIEFQTYEDAKMGKRMLEYQKRSQEI